MAKARVPLPVALNIDEFSGGTISRFSSFIKNGIIQDNDAEPDKKTFVTQRPAINVFEDPASESVADRRGRGIYFWEETDSRYFVNNDEIYVGDYTTTVTGTLTAGTGKVYMAELDTTIVVIDPDNNEGWTISTGDVLTQITDADFPDTSASETLIGGVVVLNGYAFVGTESGKLFNSDNGDATMWEAAGFVTAERAQDAGVHIAPHHDHIAFFGNRTIEFFFDAGLPAPASPLKRRADLFYQVGCAERDTAWTASDETMFVGTDGSGGIGVYRLANFKLQKVSPFGMDAYLTQVLTDSTFSAFGSGFTAQGRKFYVLTIHTTPSDISSTQTFVYDVIRNVWYLWGTGLTIVDTNANFPIIDFTITSGSSPRTGEGIAANGTLINFENTLIPVDSEGQSLYITSGYWPSDYSDDVAGNSANIELTVRTGHQDFGESNAKYPSEVRVVGDFTDTDADNATLRWSDGDHSSYATYSRSINLGRQDRVKRNGKFNRRSWELFYDGAEVVRAESLDVFIREGRN